MLFAYINIYVSCQYKMAQVTARICQILNWGVSGSLSERELDVKEYTRNKFTEELLLQTRWTEGDADSFG